VTVTTPALRAAFRILCASSVRTVTAKPRPAREPRWDPELPSRLQALAAQGITDINALARAAGCSRTTAWRYFSGKS
jgi:hypothetical protein